MQINVSGKRLDTTRIAQLITQGEKNVDSIEIVLPVMYGDIDLSALSWALAGVSDKETRVEQQLVKSVNGDSLTLTWTITEKWAAVSGCLLLELSGFNQDSTTVIKFTGKPIEVQPSAELFGLPAPDLAAEYLETMREIAAEARQAAEAIAQAGLKILDYYPTLASLQTSVTSPKLADMYGVGVSPGIFAYVWNGTVWVKGHQLDPAVSSVNGQTGNVALTATDMTAAFSQASTKANIATGEKLSVIFGKLMKWYASFGAAAWMNTGTTSSTVALGNHTHTAAAVGAVPTSRKVNGKALSGDVNLTAPDVGARAEDWLPTLAQVGGVRPNLLDNAHRLINQMGITTRSTSGYMPDRWFCYLSPNAVGHFDLLSDGNLRITKTSGDYMVVSQRFERAFWNKLIGKVVTVSVLVGADLLTASFTVAASGYQAASLLGGIYNIGIDTLAEYGYVQLVLFSNITTGVISPMKLEDGQGQTLAQQDANGNWILNEAPPNSQQELAKCQRYLQHLHRYCFFIGAVLDANTIDFYVPLPVPMRVSPSMLNTGGITINGISGFTVTSAVTYNSDSYARCRAVKTNHGIAVSTTIFASVDADDVFLSAEL